MNARRAHDEQPSSANERCSQLHEGIASALHRIDSHRVPEILQDINNKPTGQMTSLFFTSDMYCRSTQVSFLKDDLSGFFRFPDCPTQALILYRRCTKMNGDCACRTSSVTASRSGVFKRFHHSKLIIYFNSQLSSAIVITRPTSF